MSKLVNTTYVSGPKDELAVKDVYAEGSSANVNSYQEKDNAAIEAVDNSVTGEGAPGNDPLGDFLSQNGNFSDQVTVDVTSVQTHTAEQAAERYLNQNGAKVELVSSVKTGSAADVAKKYMEQQGVGTIGGFKLPKGLAKEIAGLGAGLLGGNRAALTSSIQGLTSRAKDLLGFSSLDKKIGSFDLAKAATSLANGNMNILSAFGDLPPEFKRAISFGASPESLKRNAVTAIGGTVTRLTRGLDPDAVEPMSRIVNGLTNGATNFTGINRGGQSALISSVSYLGGKMGIPNVFSSISNTIDDKGVLMAAARPLLQRAVATGDLGIVKDIVKSNVKNQITKIVPSVVTGVMGGLKKPEELSQQEYSRYYRDMKNTMNDINPNWSTYERKGSAGGTKVVNASAICSNPFVGDLIRSQMNDLRAGAEGNTQSVYPSSGLRSVVVSPLGSSQIEVGVVPPLDPETAPTAMPSSFVAPVVADPDAYGDEPYMLLGEVFPGYSVKDELQKHFPDFHETLSHDPDVILTV